MRVPLRIRTSSIRGKIVQPYLLLVLCLTIALTFLVARLTVGALQDRIDNRLIEAGQVTSDVLVSVEDQQLTQLRPMVFTQGVDEAIAARDQTRLAALLLPHWANAGLSTLVVFDRTGQPLLSWQRAAGAPATAPPQDLAVTDLANWWIVQQIVQGNSDTFGDKFSAFQRQRLYTAAPVRSNGKLAGGVMVAVPVNTLLDQLQSRSQASATTLYDADGRAVATTYPVAAGVTIPSVPAETLSQLRRQLAAPKPAHVQSVAAFNGREYQLAYSPLQIRRQMNGFFSVALPRQFIIDAWANARIPLALLSALLVVAVVWVGDRVSRSVTRPLGELVTTARAVTNGELHRRSSVTSNDEVGELASAFNQMTQRLLHLYETSRALSKQTQFDTILAETNAAVQPLVPGAVAVALLHDQDTYRFYCGNDAPTAIQALQHTALPDSATIAKLIGGATTPVLVRADAPHLQSLCLPVAYHEVCCIALKVQDQSIGLLLLLHTEPDLFTVAVLEPLNAVASMTATAIHNTRLYLEIQAEGHRRQIILQSIADSVVVCDGQRNVVLMNTAAETLFNIRDWHDRRYHFDDLPLTLTDEPRALLPGSEQLPVRYEAHGQVLDASSAPWSTTSQDLPGEVIVFHNISDEVALDHAKTDLIGMISHELRTPLTGILGAVDLLGKGIGGQLLPLQSELAETALRQCRAMSAIIDKAILVANIETGNLAVDLRPIGVADLIDATVYAAKGTDSQKQRQINVDLADDLPYVVGDDRLLREALHQIVDNAIKYSERAPVTIFADRCGDGVEIAVRDEGPGIPAEDLPHLFSRMRRGAGSNNTAPRGLGLGLVITRALIERQGGTIRARSTPGQGSTFTIFLPGVAHAAQPLVA